MDQDRFADRHVGPDLDQQATMLRSLGFASLDELTDAAAAPGDPHRRAARPAPGAQRGRGARRPPRARVAQPGVHVPHRDGLLGHGHPRRDPAQRPREPGLVHRVHAVPARDLPGAARGAPELPDDGRGPHRHGPRERVAARRGDRGGRGDGDVPAARAEGRRHVLRGPRLPPADGRGGADAAPSRSGSTSSSATPRRTCLRTGCSARCCSTRDRAARCATTPTSSSGCTRRARS